MTTAWTEALQQGLRELHEQASMQPGEILIIGTSTSEVRGEHIGKAGTLDTAALLWEAFADFQQETGVHLAFQGCEHINRAVLIEKETADAYHLEPVHVIPVASAGGSMAEHAYKQMQHPVVVEEIRAHAGIDIGDTFIGMHLKKVAVPVRTSVKQVGEAHVTYARTRPKLIGGARAHYG